MNVLLNGALGKMGNEVKEAIKKQEELKIVCGFDREENLTGEFPIYSNLEKIKEKIDVIIDFSVPVATFRICKRKTYTNSNSHNRIHRRRIKQNKRIL